MSFTVEQALRKLSKWNGSRGQCWDDDSSLPRLNDARELIYSRGAFVCTTGWAFVKPLADGSFTLPLNFESLLGAYVCNSGVQILGSNHLLTNREHVSGLCVSMNGAVNHVASYHQDPFKRPYWYRRACDGGMSFRLVASHQDDKGVEIMIKSKDARGVTSEMRLKLDIEEGVSSDDTVNDIESVTKPITKGDVLMYGDVDGEEYLMAVWNAKSENPRFTRFKPLVKIPCRHGLGIHGKRKCEKLTDLDEIVDIESWEALKFAYKALNAQEAADGNGEYVTNIQLLENALDKSDANLTSTEPSAPIRINYNSLQIGAEYE